jgi:hypothetical protein
MALRRLRSLPRRCGVNSIARRLSWGLADQAVSSITNFAVGMVVARETDAASFGAFTIVWVSYFLVVNVSRGLATDPLVVRFSGVTIEAWRNAVARSTGTVVALGGVAGTVALITGLSIGGTLGISFIGLGLVLPGLLLQDSWRFAFFASKQGKKAFLNDVVCGAVLVPTLIVAAHVGGVCGFVLAWGFSATVAAIYGSIQAELLPRVAGARSWLVQQRDLTSRYLVENVSVGGQTQLRMYGLAVIAGLPAVGATRGAQLLLGPFFALLMGIGLVAVPEAASLLRRSPQRMLRLCLLLGAGQAGAALAWGLAVMFVMPDAIGRLILESVWEPASELILPITLYFAGMGLASGAVTGLRALGAARRSLRAQIFACATLVASSLIGAWVTRQALGAAWGAAIATGLCVPIWWAQLRSGLREFGLRSSTEYEVGNVARTGKKEGVSS